MEIIIIISIFIFVYVFTQQRDKSEKNKFREFVIAVKTKNIVEYKEAIPEEGELLQEEIKDDFVPLEDVDSSVLLNALKKDEDNKNTN